MTRRKTGSSAAIPSVPANTVGPAASSTLSLTIGRAPSIACQIPAVPPTSNHIWVHTRGNHFRTPEYDAWLWLVKGKIKPKKPLVGGLAVSVDVHFSRKGSYARSDVDNRVKAVLDALKRAGAFQDDNQVVLLCASKHLMDRDQTIVGVFELA